MGIGGTPGIDTGIGLSGSIKSSNWTPQLLESNTGAQNLAILNAGLLTHRKVHIKVNTTGIYNFDNTILIPSNTEITFDPGVTLKKETASSFSHLIANLGMVDKTRNTNIKIYGNGLKLDINGIEAYSDIFSGTRGVFQFTSVDNFIVDNIYSHNLTMTDQFMMCYLDCTHGNISNLDFLGTKDCCPLVSCQDIIMEDSSLISSDDSVAIGIGYPSVTPIVKNSERITIRRITSGCPSTPAGYVTRIGGGSWDVWTNGRTYHSYEMCTNNGIIYGRYDLGNKVASVAPTHTSGVVTGADGIQWIRQYGSGSYATAIDITFQDITIISQRAFASVKSEVYITQGTEGNALLNNIVFDNITFPANYTSWALDLSGLIGNVTFKNTTFTSSQTVGNGGLAHGTSGTDQGITKLLYQNCNISVVAGNFLYTGSNYKFTEIEIDTVILTLATGNFLYPGGAGSSYGKFTSIDSEIIDPAGYLFLLAYNGHLPVINCTRTIFTGIDVWMHTGAANITTTATLVDCEFKTSIGYILSCVMSGGVQNYISTGTKYINPSGYLFATNQAAGTQVINLSTSSGSVTPAKVRLNANTTVIACDLAYV